MNIVDYIIIISSYVFSTQTQSLCFFPNSLFNQSEAFDKCFWRNEKLTKVQRETAKILAVNRKGRFRELFEKITYHITRANNKNKISFK